MWHFDHAEHGSPPARGRHDKGSYLQEEIVASLARLIGHQVIRPVLSVNQITLRISWMMS